jgi:polyferredoxin
MPGNPLTDPNWATELADTVERLVGTVRERATTPVVHIARGVVYGLICAFLGVMALVLFLIAFTRALQALLDLAVDTDQAVYLSYLILGGILSIAGLLVLKKRQTPDA